MTLVASSTFFKHRSSLIHQLDLKKCPKQSRCKKFGERLCRIWRAICELFSPKLYQRKLSKQLTQIQSNLATDKYLEKLNRFYKKFAQEAKKEALSLLQNQKNSPHLKSLLQMPLDTKDSIQEFTNKLQNQFGMPMYGKLLLLSDCFEWKEKMIEQRGELVKHVDGAKVKNDYYERTSHLIKKAKQLLLVQSKDVKSYAHFMRDFAGASSELTIQETSQGLFKLEKEKNGFLEKYQDRKKNFEQAVVDLKRKNKPSQYRLNYLNSKLKLVETHLKATNSAFSDLYGDWILEMNEIKANMSTKSCSSNLELLAFWKKKLQGLTAGKMHLDLFVEKLLMLDRICLNLKSKSDLNGMKLVTSGLTSSLREALVAFSKDVLIHAPKPIPVQVSKFCDSLIKKRLAYLNEKSRKFLPKDDDSLLHELQRCGWERCHVPTGGNSFFDACVKAIQETSVEFKEMNGALFRKALYEYIKNNKQEFVEKLVAQLKKDPLPMYLISEELMKKDFPDDQWLADVGINIYLEAMGERFDISPGNVELDAAEKLLKAPIKIHEKGSVDDSYKYRKNCLHLLRINEDFDTLLPQNI